jgi:integrase
MLKRPPERVSWAAIKRVLEAIDRARPLGKRDFAIFVTAASYGWGAPDVLSLRLDDIDWYRNTLSIICPKTDVRIEVPLRTQVAHALATYIYRRLVPLTPESARSSCETMRHGPRCPLQTLLRPICNDMQKSQESRFHQDAR